MWRKKDPYTSDLVTVETYISYITQLKKRSKEEKNGWMQEDLGFRL